MLVSSVEVLMILELIVLKVLYLNVKITFHQQLMSTDYYSWLNQHFVLGFISGGLTV